MEEYYFLFVLAFIWLVFASIQDFRKTEVANWLNFSLIAFALAYRAFYAVAFDNLQFLGFGLLGFGVFFILAHLFYYTRVFAGGDAKLLMGLGIILPFNSYSEFVLGTGEFIFLMFTLGLIYGIVYSTFLVRKDKKKFFKHFDGIFKGIMKAYLFSIIVLGIAALLLGILGLFIPVAIALFVFFVLYGYLKAIEGIMVKKVEPGKLMEGDWLVGDVKVGRNVIKKSVHGLSFEEIKMLKRAKKKVVIMNGLPFVPAFLLSFSVMVFFFLVLSSWPYPLSFLF